MRDDLRRHPGQGDGASVDAGRSPAGHHPGRSSPSWTPCRRTAPSSTSIRRSAASSTLDALKRLLLRESQEQPLLLVFEDLHWIDTETQALLDSLVESLPTARILLLVNYRPEYQHGWGSKTYYTQLRLDPLPPVSAEDLLAGAARGRPQSGAAHAAPDRAHRGQSVLSGRERAHPGGDRPPGRASRGAYRLAQSLPTHPGAGDGAGGAGGAHRPAAARGEASAPDRRGDWHRGALGPCSRPSPSCLRRTLHRGLAHLQAAEFLYETRLFPDQEYTFKHALTHEVAYGSLLQERRRVLHARIVEALEALAGDRLTEQVERLAHHALRGEVWDKALAYCRQAGEKAMARSAHREAVGYFEQALSALAASAGGARHARAGHRSPVRPAFGAPPTRRLRAYPGVPARGRGPRDGPR